MHRPIETRAMGDVVVNQFEVREYARGALLVVCCFREPDGEVYERVRIVMPASSVRWSTSGGVSMIGGEFPPPH